MPRPAPPRHDRERGSAAAGRARRRPRRAAARPDQRHVGARRRRYEHPQVGAVARLVGEERPRLPAATAPHVGRRPGAPPRSGGRGQLAVCLHQLDQTRRAAERRRAHVGQRRAVSRTGALPARRDSRRAATFERADAQDVAHGGRAGAQASASISPRSSRAHGDVTTAAAERDRHARPRARRRARAACAASSSGSRST